MLYRFTQISESHIFLFYFIWMSFKKLFRNIEVYKVKSKCPTPQRYHFFFASRWLQARLNMFPYLYWPFLFLHCELPFSSLCPLVSIIVFIFSYGFVMILCILKVLVSCLSYTLQIFFSVLPFSFHFVYDNFLCIISHLCSYKSKCFYGFCLGVMPEKTSHIPRLCK